MKQHGYRASLVAALDRRLVRALSIRVRDHVEPTFRTGRELVAFQRDAANDAARKNAVLLALLSLHQELPNTETAELLLAAMLPAVARFVFAECDSEAIRRGRTDEEIWAETVAAFLEACRSLPIETNPDHIAATLVGTLRNASRARRARKRTPVGRVAPSADIALSVTDDDSTLAEVQQVRQRVETPFAPDELAPLETLLKKLGGEFDEVDRALLIGNLIRDQSIRELARDLGLRFEAAKSRFRRAFRRLEEVRDERLARAVVVRDRVAMEGAGEMRVVQRRKPPRRK